MHQCRKVPLLQTAGAAVELLLAVFLLPFVDHHGLYSSFPNLNPARLAEI
jgi:hypothetical protein